jgi:hypothetical protein
MTLGSNSPTERRHDRFDGVLKVICALKFG